MSSIIAKIFHLNCLYVNDPSEPYVCLTKSGFQINPVWILTADIFLILILLVLGYFAVTRIIKYWRNRK